MLGAVDKKLSSHLAAFVILRFTPYPLVASTFQTKSTYAKSSYKNTLLLPLQNAL